MTVADITNAVNTVGFPIVSWGALFWYMVKIGKDNTTAINNNTIVLTKLTEKIGSEKEESK